MRINFACGKQTWDGFYCVDAVKHPRATRDPDLLHVLKFDGATLENPLPLDDGVASELHSYHFLEHVAAWEAVPLVKEWARLLKHGGRLILELPNIELAANNLLAGSTDQMSMWALYGNQELQDPFMCHKFGYTSATVRKILESNGFAKVKILAPQTHGARVNRDMRVEAIRI